MCLSDKIPQSGHEDVYGHRGCSHPLCVFHGKCHCGRNGFLPGIQWVGFAQCVHVSVRLSALLSRCLPDSQRWTQDPDSRPDFHSHGNYPWKNF